MTISVEREPSLVVTPGVVRVGDGYFCESLCCAVSVRELDYEQKMLDYGMASEPPRRGLFGALWPRSRAVLMPHSIPAAVVRSLLHNSMGMLLWWCASLALILVGLVSTVPSFIALGVALILFFSAVLIHEVGHVVAFRLRAGPWTTGVLVSRGVRCYMVRPAINRAHECLVILAGPCAPLSRITCSRAVPGGVSASFLVVARPGSRSRFLPGFTRGRRQ
ncbi:hypothetical protein C5D47_09320 [Rathayibacter toxicus]|uniref:Uncharacterized protein n=1 Tax=Rathayibacter toxicus TaxID=145458 RepID=A0A2S5Y584_9MICO|nr:hypothetical protein C5D17_09310 [Rathayibacter toxicus]PPH56160.1 hypothetical protein C5D30_09300 [Rathayibacter toxicus]PPH58255.1 hypothetical protein C5C93_09350 [Rathayibacter toxicus]PPH86002.1 hypothetical protein C5D31_09330 [Rathayibacter toxicus]PPI13885.1 hypothetical protein C5C51_09275 [Rathayibacter toxicus]